MTPPEGYRHSTEITIRFADIDMMGHVNHATYLTYVEHARIHYVQQVCKVDRTRESFGMIVAHAEVDYALPLLLGDRVTVFTRCTRLGTKSLELAYTLVRQPEDGVSEVAARAKTVMVTYDYNQHASVPVPDNWRQAITDYEPSLA